MSKSCQSCRTVGASWSSRGPRCFRWRSRHAPSQCGGDKLIAVSYCSVPQRPTHPHTIYTHSVHLQQLQAPRDAIDGHLRRWTDGHGSHGPSLHLRTPGISHDVARQAGVLTAEDHGHHLRDVALDNDNGLALRRPLRDGGLFMQLVLASSFVHAEYGCGGATGCTSARSATRSPHTHTRDTDRGSTGTRSFRCPCSVCCSRPPPTSCAAWKGQHQRHRRVRTSTTRQRRRRRSLWLSTHSLQRCCHTHSPSKTTYTPQPTASKEHVQVHAQLHHFGFHGLRRVSDGRG